MSAFVKPVYPADLHAPGAVDDLLAFHKATFGGWTMTETAGEGAGAGQEGAGGTTGAAGGQQQAATPPFPPNTAPDDMTPTQREAYYKAETSKWRGRADKNYSLLRELGITDDDTAAQVKAKLAEHTELSKAQMTAVEKAAAEATEKATEAAAALYRPKLVKAAFGTAAAGKIEPDRLATILEPLDLSKFLKGSGEVDAKKVADYVEGLTPTKGTQQRTGPSAFGLGQQPPAAGAPGAQGRAMAEKRGFIKPDAAAKS